MGIRCSSPSSGKKKKNLAFFFLQEREEGDILHYKVLAVPMGLPLALLTLGSPRPGENVYCCLGF